MAVNPDNVDFTTIEDVSDIEPEPTIAVTGEKRHVGSLGREGRMLLGELLRETSDDEPFADRVFGRLGVGYSHRRWNDADVYWADDEDAFVEALRGWNSARSM